MTITIQIKSNEKELKKKMGLFQRKHLPKATANAINEIGAKVVNAERAQIQKRLDRPTPFTIKSVDMPAKFRAKPNDLAAVSSAGGERLNAYGNLIGLKAKRIDSRKDMFLNKNALWKREGDGGLKLIAVAKNFIKHRKLLDFFKIGFGVIKKNYDKELDKQIKKAIRR